MTNPRQCRGYSAFGFGGMVTYVCGVLGLIAVAMQPSCRRVDDETVASDVRPTGKLNVILISIDTLRADHLSCYGYERKTTPAIDALAARGVRFSTVVSESSWTGPSHMTLFTGLYPTTHGLCHAGAWPSTSTVTLPEVLQEDGYRTFAFVGGGHVTKYGGFSRGFERFYVKEKHGLSASLEHARKYIDGFKADERFFLFIHAYDVHSPYENEEPYASMFVSQNAEPFDDWARNELRFKDDGINLTPGNIQFLADHYDGGIRHVDDLLGEFIQFLDDRKLFDNTLVVLLSDHGEEFGEHGFLGHRGSLYREYITPPLIVVAPGVEARVVEQGVGLKDVMPTVLALAELQAPQTQGQSLVPLLHGEVMDPWPLFSEVDYDGSYRSLVWDKWHLIVRPYGGAPMLFDWRNDPTEQVDVASQNPDRIKKLLVMIPDLPKSFRHPEFPLSQIEALGHRKPPKTHRPDSVEVASEVDPNEVPSEIQKLRSLGYIGGN